MASDPAARAGEPRRPPWWFVIHAAILLVVVLDWLTSAGTVVGVALAVPIVMSSSQDDEWQVWLAGAVAIVGFVAVATLGHGLAWPTVWLPDRWFALLTILASVPIAVLLQRRRLEAERARDAAVGMRDMNRLLVSLLAHDLRAPLALADDGIDYVETALAHGRPIDVALLGDVRARLRRSLRSLDVTLAVARTEAGARRDAGTDAGTDAVPHRTTAQVRDELVAELDAFEHEAAARAKSLAIDFSALPNREYAVDVLVVRQALAILVDNAIRHARPGPVQVTGAERDGVLSITVADAGPAGGRHPTPLPGAAEIPGLGLGLDLCRALVRHAGGSLQTSRTDSGGTEVVLRLPVGSEAGVGSRK